MAQTKDMVVGAIYGGTLTGDIYKDESGQVWWLRAYDGDLVKIYPHKHHVWYRK